MSCVRTLVINVDVPCLSLYRYNHVLLCDAFKKMFIEYNIIILKCIDIYSKMALNKIAPLSKLMLFHTWCSLAFLPVQPVYSC